ncbi:hypothetical protein K432DRAFT_127530 [Lepidopterella palustris CBS 459.81]|uniref:Septin-type G domain-containing protein n=1 Tax=Lepidopterella palustris CBS 459.81 TaxID=1314670 RepID=A0A8E2E4D7_9PEZI|nr:hypothetical protein K432DRAFT_127530 [Lepidopterella palustris CBS 459.81]
MRPTAGGDALSPTRPRSRKSSVADRSGVHTAAAHNVPTTFFLRSEEDMEQSLAESASTTSTNKPKDSTYGVQSLADALESAFGDGNDLADDKKKENAAGSMQKSEDTSSGHVSNISEKAHDLKPESLCSRDTSPEKHHNRQTSHHTLSTPLTPLNVESPVQDSGVPSTPKSVSLKSFRLSDEESGVDEATSQAITSSGEEEEDDAQIGESGNFPQLVMPSIQMPSRRPFTTRGKNVGRLKVLIAGEAGVGKTSLIRSIVQLCEDIVHVDPLSPTQSASQPSPPPKSKSRRRKTDIIGTSRIIEVHASTKAYPSWWTDMEESRVMRKRKSIGDTVLERNLCFIDTPGYGKTASCIEDMDLVIDYIESLLRRNASIGAMSDGDLLAVLSGNGGVQVDVVFYLLSPIDDMSKDVEYMQRLSSLTNVIPLIAKADTLTVSQIISIKTNILTHLQTTSIKPFLFGKTLDDALSTVQGLSISSLELSPGQNTDNNLESSQSQSYFRIPTAPYTISSTPGPDTETMDASLLMSPDYVQPLMRSELTALVEQVFDPDTISWLRHSAVKKFLAWRNRTNLSGESMILQGYPQQRGYNSRSPSLSLNTAGFSPKTGLQDPFARLTTAPTSSSSSIFSPASPSGVLVPHPHSPFCFSHPNSNSNFQSPFLGSSSPSLSHSPLDGLEGPSDFALARCRDNIQREERIAQVRLAKWATDLQRSLRNEKERYEELKRGERARWLLERVGEEVKNGNIISSPTPSGRADWAVIRHGSGKGAGGAGQRYGRAGKVDSRDPLGLCELSDGVRRRGVVVLKVLGGMGVLGAVVVAVARTCGVETDGGFWGWIFGNGE